MAARVYRAGVRHVPLPDRYHVTRRLLPAPPRISATRFARSRSQATAGTIYYQWPHRRKEIITHGVNDKITTLCIVATGMMTVAYVATQTTRARSWQIVL